MTDKKSAFEPVVKGHCRGFDVEPGYVYRFPPEFDTKIS